MINDLLQILGRSNICLIKIQWSLTMPQSPKNVFCLYCMIENDLLQNLGRPIFFSMIVNDLWRITGVLDFF